MTDTPPKIEDLYIRKIMARSPAERLAMGTRMFHTARTLVIAGIRAQHPDIDENELKVRVFRRFYGEDFSSEELDRISARLVSPTSGSSTS